MMAKSKRAPALFEVMKSTPGAVPGARGERAGTPGQDQSSVHPDAATENRLPAAAPEETPPAPGEIGPCPGESDSGPVCAVQGGRVRFSLTQRAATVAIAVAGLVLAGVWYVGYVVGEARGREKGRLDIQAPLDDYIEQVRQAAPTRNLFEGIGADPTVAVAGPEHEEPAGEPASETAEGPARRDVPWVVGHNYIVVQDFKRGARGDAVRARDFLEKNGVQAAIIELERSGTYRYRLITVTGFNLDDPVQKRLANEHLSRVRRIGRVYSESGGRYDFKSAYFKKLPGNQW